MDALSLNDTPPTNLTRTLILVVYRRTRRPCNVCGRRRVLFSLGLVDGADVVFPPDNVWRCRECAGL